MHNSTSGAVNISSPERWLSALTGPRERAVAAADVARILHGQLISLADALNARGAGRFEEGSLSSFESTTEGERPLAEAVDSCREELLVVQPGGPRPPEEAMRRDRGALERGARLRSVYQHATRHDAATVSRVRELTEAGAEVRTFDEVISRLVIVDHRVAFIPTATDNSTAVLITQPAVVAYLGRLFEYVWARADPFLPHTARNITTPVRDLMINLLIEGATGTAIAKRLGISERTLANHIARLKKECKAKSSFQLGYRLACENRQRSPMASRHRD
jgi:biotin operon repressor